MGEVAGGKGEYSLGSLNDSTGWLDLNSIVDDIAFNITGTFSGTVSMQVSNQNDLTKTRLSTITTYTTTQSPLNIPREIGRFVRFIMTSYSSGTAYLGFSKGKNENGQLSDVRPQTSESGQASGF